MKRKLLFIFICIGFFLFFSMLAVSRDSAEYGYDDSWGMPYGQMGMMGMDGHMGFGGMMGNQMPFGQLSVLDLTNEQEKKINALQDGLRKKHWEKMGEIMDLQAKLRDAYRADKPDPKAVGDIYDKISSLQRTMLEERVATMNNVRDILNDKQRAQLKSTTTYGWGRGPGPMMRHGSRYSWDQ